MWTKLQSTKAILRQQLLHNIKEEINVDVYLLYFLNEL